MKNFRITVNGNTYDVAVEEIAPEAAPAASAPVSAPAAPVPKAAPAPQKPAAGSKAVKAPMPGNIYDIKVNVGEKVAENQVVIILEAMKMENEIVSPFSGTVASINVKKGNAVNSGDVLMTIAE